MGMFFSKRSPPAENRQSRVTEQDKAVLGLKQQRDRIKKYQKQVEGKLQRDKEVARDLLKAGKKDKALLLLKKKRYMEGLLTKTDNQLDNLEQMVQNLEFAQIEVKVVEGLDQGNTALKSLHEVFSLEDVEKIMDDTQDAVEYQQQIDTLLGTSLSPEDEDAVLEELEALTAAELNDMEAQLPDVPTTEPSGAEIPEMPEVPETEPGAAAKARRQEPEMIPA